MNWSDVGGTTQVKHVVVRENPGIHVGVLCKQPVQASNYIERRKPLPHCLKCIAALKKLIRESDILYEFKPAKNFISPSNWKET